MGAGVAPAEGAEGALHVVQTTAELKASGDSRHEDAQHPEVRMSDGSFRIGDCCGYGLPNPGGDGADS